VTTSSSVGAESTGLRTSRRPGSRILLWIGLVLLLVAELIVLTLPFNLTGNLGEKGFWAAVLSASQHGIRPTFITAVAATIFLSWPVLQQEFRRILSESPTQIISARWLAAHLIFLGLLIVGTQAHGIRVSSMADWEGWLFLWSFLACGALVTWLFSALPPRFWVRWIGHSRTAVLGGGAAGLAAYALGNWTQELWGPLQRSTFQMVAMILQLFGQAAVNRPDEMALGTSRFAVTITPHCSGLEGIGLMCAFTGVYLWSCRRQLMFPQALLLLPIGAVCAWVLNAIRIAALIFIGGWNQDVALKGFHSAAGWIFFNLVAVGLIWTSSSSQWFAKAHESRLNKNPAVGYVLPLLVFFASSLTANMFSLSFEFFLPAVTIPVLCVLWYCRSTLLSLPWKFSWLNVLAGVVVFAMILVTSEGSSADTSIGSALRHLPMPVAAGSLLFCLVGSAIAIPIAQELAFRGYVTRKLVAADFESVPFDRFTWISFLGSSILFGITEPNWLPLILAGMIFALVMYRRGLLTDAIIAHSCSSGLLFLVAAATGRWSLLG
jgi:exosortase E/protease (VPEID-CTERM system)